MKHDDAQSLIRTSLRLEIILRRYVKLIYLSRNLFEIENTEIEKFD